MLERRTGPAPSTRPSSRPLSRRASNTTLAGAAPDSLRHNNHGSRVWGQPSEGPPSTAEFVSAAAWSTGPGSPHGDTSSALFVDARQDSCASSQDDLTQHSGSLYTATSTLSQFVQAATATTSGSVAPSDLANTPRSSGTAGAISSIGGSTMREGIRSVHSLTDTSAKQYAHYDAHHGAPLTTAERSATAMEIVSGALSKPNAWAAGAPAWERGGEAGPGGQSDAQNGAVAMGLQIHPAEAFYQPQQHRTVDTYELTRTQFPNSRAPDGAGRGGYGGRASHQGDAFGGGGKGGYSGAGGEGAGRGRYKAGRGGGKMRSSSAGSFGGGREGGGGRGHRNGGRGGYQHAQDRQVQAAVAGSDRGVVTRVSNSESSDAGRGVGAAASAGAAAAMAVSAASQPQPDPRLLLDNTQQFPALEGASSTSPRAAMAAAVAAQWPAKDRLAVAPAPAPDRPATASRAGSIMSGGGASGRLMSDISQAAPAAAVEATVSPPLQRAWSDQPKERYGTGGVRSAAEILARAHLPPSSATGTAEPGQNSRHGAPPARKSVSSWSEVAQSPAVGGAPRSARGGGGGANCGGGGGTYVPPAPASDSGPVRPWHMSGPRGAHGAYGGGRGAGGRRGGYNGSHHGYPTGNGASRVTHQGEPPPRRGRSEEGGPRPSDSRSNGSGGR